MLMQISSFCRFNLHSKQRPYIYVKRYCKLLNGIKGWISVPSLESTHVATREPAPVSEGFLGHTCVQSHGLYSSAEPYSKWSIHPVNIG